MGMVALAAILLPVKGVQCEAKLVANVKNKSGQL